VCKKRKSGVIPNPVACLWRTAVRDLLFVLTKVNDLDVEQLSMVHECSKTTPSILLHKQLDVTPAPHTSLAALRA
jgi:hypothetical protein